jgi:hypothetical protein
VGDQATARRQRRGPGTAHGDLDELVAEQALRDDARLRVRPDAVAKARAIVSVTLTLPPGSLASATSVTRPICTPARRTVAPSMSPPTSLNSATEIVLPLEVARLRAEQVDDGEEDAEPGQDEGADPDLERAQARLRHRD